MIAVGDFKDTPDGGQFGMGEGLLCNKAAGLQSAGEGTIGDEGNRD